jgi:hypothetical protein
MSVLTDRRDRRGPARVALLAVGVLVVVLVAALVILGHHGSAPAPRASARVVGQKAPPPLASAPHALAPAAAASARAFLAGYLAWQYGQGASGQIRDASPQLAATLSPARLAVNPAALGLHPVIDTLGASETGGDVLHVEALISDGRARYPIGIVVTHEGRGWTVTQLANPE